MQVQVNWVRRDGQIDPLGSRKVSFTYLKLENSGRVDAKDCQVTIVPSEKSTDTYFPVELPLAFATLTMQDCEMTVGENEPYRIQRRGRNLITPMKETIFKNGGQATILLAFTIEGYDSLFMAVVDGATGGKIPTTRGLVTLRTSVDGKKHVIEITPRSTGGIEARVLSSN